MLFLFANGKAARVELSAYQTKSNRRKLTGAYSDHSELRGIFLLQEDVQLVLYSTEGRALILQTAQLAPKTTRTTLGVAVLTLRRKAELSRACPFAESGIVNESRYRTLPAAGALLRGGRSRKADLSRALIPHSGRAVGAEKERKGGTSHEGPEPAENRSYFAISCLSP